MNGKTSRLIRRAALALQKRGVIKSDGLKKAIKKVKRDYQKLSDTKRVRFKTSLSMIPHLSDEETLNKLAGKVS